MDKGHPQSMGILQWPYLQRRGIDSPSPGTMNYQYLLVKEWGWETTHFIYAGIWAGFILSWVHECTSDIMPERRIELFFNVLLLIKWNNGKEKIINIKSHFRKHLCFLWNRGEKLCWRHTWTFLLTSPLDRMLKRSINSSHSPNVCINALWVHCSVFSKCR